MVQPLRLGRHRHLAAHWIRRRPELWHLPPEEPGVHVALVARDHAQEGEGRDSCRDPVEVTRIKNIYFRINKQHFVRIVFFSNKKLVL